MARHGGLAPYPLPRFIKLLNPLGKVKPKRCAARHQQLCSVGVATVWYV